MSKWEKVKLRDVCEINIGKTPSRDNVLFWNNGIYKWLSISDMQDKYLIDSKEKISMEAVGKCNMKLIPINTVVMSFKLSVGKVGILSEPMYSNEAIANFPILNCEKLHANFLYYALQSLKFENMDRAAKGLTLNKAKLNQLKIPFPPLEVQQKIAQTLDAAAALLALRKEQLAEMDNLIKSVFYEMFGDPVANEKGWQVIFVQDVYTIIDGDRGVNYPKQNDFIKDGYCLFLNTGNVTKEGFKFDDLKFISEEKDKELRKGKMERGDVILTTRGTVGNIAYYNKDIAFNVVRINSGMVILRNRCKEIHPLYFCELFKNKEMGRRISSFLSGTAQPQLPITNLKKIRFPLPPLSRQNQFAEIVTKIEEQKVLVQKAIDESQYLFDSLMNEYFN